MSQPRIRIIRVIARLNVGGPAKHVVWLTAGLAGKGFDSLLVAGSVPAGEDDMGYFADQMGVAPLFIPEMSREISPRDVVAIWKLFRLFRREQPKIVHTHTAKAGTVGRVAGFFYRWLTVGTLIGRPKGCKFVHTYHGHIFHSYYGPLKTRIFIEIEKILARLATDRILVISEQQRTEIHERFRIGRTNQFRVIPLGLDLAVFASWRTRGRVFRQEFNISENTILVGIVGRLTPIKNHKLFLRSVAYFKTISPQAAIVKFVIIGDGSLRDSLEELSQSLGLQDEVIFAGTRRDSEEFYPALDVVALTSRNEGTPLTLIEAMANARPVIATKVGGVVDLLGEPREQIGDYQRCERGLSVAANDEKAFAAGMVRLVQDEQLREELGLRGLQFVTEHYRKERLLEDVATLYKDLVDTGAEVMQTTEPTLNSRF